MKNKRLFTFITTIIIMFSVCTDLPLKVAVPLKADAATNVSNLYPVDSTYSLIKSLEGCDLNCFWDVAQWTIGYGNKCPYTHTSNGTYWHQNGGHSISESEARSLFNNKLSGYVNILKSNCSGLSMTQNQFDALLSATYNHGNVLPNGCKSCGYKKHPLVQYLLGNLTESQAREQYYVWCINAGTKDEQGLRNRRKKEADVFFGGPPDEKIVTPTISTDKSYYAVGDTVNISWTASPSDSNLSHYWLNVIAPDGTYVYGDGMGKNTSYSFIASQSGSYSITTYATPLESANGEGSLTDSVSISVSQPVWHADLSPADVGSEFYAYIINVASWNHLTNDNGNVATYPETGAANQIWKFDRCADGSYKITNCADGNVLDVVNFGSTNGTNVAICDSNDASAQRWFIYGSSGDYRFRAACTDCVMDAVKSLSSGGTNVEMWTKNDNPGQVFQIWKLMPELSVKPGNQAELTIFNWENFPGNDRFYDLKIWKGTLWEGNPYYIEWGLKGTSYEIGLPAGHYEAYVDTRVGSQILMNNVVKFDITEDYFGQSELKVVVGDKYNKTRFEWTSVENADFYDLKIWNGTVWEGDAYQIEWGIEDTSIELALPAGYYEAYIDARDSNHMQMSNVVKFAVKRDYQVIKGDINDDGKVTVADAVLLQKWLLAEPEVELANWKAADLCEDGRLDVFDLCMMKHMLVENS